MSQSLADLLPVEGGSVDLRLWLKSSAYTRRLLLGEGDPWESGSKFLAYFSQAHGLLKPDVAVIEVGELFDAWLRRNPGLKAELGTKRKLSYPLRKLLEQEGPRALLAEVIDAVVAHLRGQTPLVLAMPSPRHWLQLANRAAGREEVEIDDDSIEDAAMYQADLVRSVSALPVGGVLLEEADASEQGGAVNVELYRPMLNVAKHYRWPLALRIGASPLLDGVVLAEIDVFIGSGELPAVGRVTGADVSATAWSSSVKALAPQQFYFAEIPTDALPEHVLDCLSRLKA